MSPILLDYEMDDQMIMQYIIAGEHEKCTQNISQKKGEKDHLGGLIIDWNMLKKGDRI
jgi:hypothetical protein